MRTIRWASIATLAATLGSFGCGGSSTTPKDAFVASLDTGSVGADSSSPVSDTGSADSRSSSLDSVVVVVEGGVPDGAMDRSIPREVGPALDLAGADAPTTPDAFPDTAAGGRDSGADGGTSGDGAGAGCPAGYHDGGNGTCVTNGTEGAGTDGGGTGTGGAGGKDGAVGTGGTTGTDGGTGTYAARAQIDTSNQIGYQTFSGGGGTIAATGGDKIDKPSWCPYNVWSVWVGGNPIVLSGVLPDDIKYPVYLIINGIGTVNESTSTPDTYLYLSVNGTVIYTGKQMHLNCCNFDDWSDNRIITLIDADGNGLGGIKRGSSYSIQVGASNGGTTRICVNALEISTTPAF